MATGSASPWSFRSPRSIHSLVIDPTDNTRSSGGGQFCIVCTVLLLHGIHQLRVLHVSRCTWSFLFSPELLHVQNLISSRDLWVISLFRLIPCIVVQFDTRFDCSYSIIQWIGLKWWSGDFYKWCFQIKISIDVEFVRLQSSRKSVGIICFVLTFRCLLFLQSSS